MKHVFVSIENGISIILEDVTPEKCLLGRLFYIYKNVLFNLIYYLLTYYKDKKQDTNSSFF